MTGSADHKEHEMTWQLFKAYIDIFTKSGLTDKDKQNIKEFISRFSLKQDKEIEIRVDQLRPERDDTPIPGEEVWITRLKTDGMTCQKANVENGIVKMTMKAGECTAITSLTRNIDGSVKVNGTRLDGFEQANLESPAPEGIYVLKDMGKGDVKCSKAKTIGDIVKARCEATAITAAGGKDIKPTIADLTNPQGGIYMLHETQMDKETLRIVLVTPATDEKKGFPDGIINGMVAHVQAKKGTTRIPDVHLLEYREGMEQKLATALKGEDIGKMMATGKLPSAKKLYELAGEYELAKHLIDQEPEEEPQPAAKPAYKIDEAENLFLAVEKNDLDGIERSILNGADPNTPDKLTGRTALHKCSSSEAARKLLENGANPHIKDINGDTPLHMACINLKKDIASGIIEFGGNTEARNNAGQTPMEKMQAQWHENDSTLDARCEIISIFVEHEEKTKKTGFKPEPVQAQTAPEANTSKGFRI